MQALMNCSITIESRATIEDDADGNKQYSYVNTLESERARSSIKVLNKLADDRNWITYKVRRFTIRDVTTDLTDATHVLYNSKYYKIEKIIEPESFSRVKHRIVETEYKEGKG